MLMTLLLLAQMQGPPEPPLVYPPRPQTVWVLRRYQPWGAYVEGRFLTYDQCLVAKMHVDRRSHPLTTFDCQQELMQ